MCAVNPSRISRGFNDTALLFVVDTIAVQGQGLLEIVNYNVENWQYVVAGELALLDCLTSVLNHLKANNVDIQALMKQMTLEQVQEKLVEIIQRMLATTQEKQRLHGRIQLERGVATIPLRGIDVPFHSSFLLPGVSPFRSYLAKKIDPANVDVNVLSENYIPNLMGEPFKLSKDFIERVHTRTKSAQLGLLLSNWKEHKTAADKQQLGYMLLVELLAYQFASPVRWIATQDVLFATFGVERLIEIGPSPTLCGMAQRTLKFKYEAHDDALTYQRTTLCYFKDAKDIYYVVDDVAPTAPVVQVTQEAKPQPQAVQASVPVHTPSAGPAQAIADVPLKAVQVVRAILAQKLKKVYDQVPVNKALKDLTGGKSTLQNEILGTL
jgi:fatty acid synthase subunit beta